MAKLNVIDWIAAILVIIGAINWGLVAMNFNLVSAIFGDGVFTKIIYGLVGLSGLWMVYTLTKVK